MMDTFYTTFRQFLDYASQNLLPHLSVDCVVFGFHRSRLRVLLLKNRHNGQWGLPGGFVGKTESLETAASRVLRERTGLDDIFLQQFHVFSEPGRSDGNGAEEFMRQEGVLSEGNNWLAQRFLTVGFYALVDAARVTPQPDAFSEECTWWDLAAIGPLMLDHSQILEKALATLRLHLNYEPIGYNLLPEKFTMPELQTLYETILGRKLDRRNF
ncbi:MAG: NUDIX domain-containing protein, partial [Cytophagales bacterium]|nr:NUDIX domain-containing protein [Cytophagales bacterium]